MELAREKVFCCSAARAEEFDWARPRSGLGRLERILSWSPVGSGFEREVVVRAFFRRSPTAMSKANFVEESVSDGWSAYLRFAGGDFTPFSSVFGGGSVGGLCCFGSCLCVCLLGATF